MPGAGATRSPASGTLTTKPWSCGRVVRPPPSCAHAYRAVAALTPDRGPPMHRLLKPQFIAVLLLAGPQGIVAAQNGSSTINVYGFVMLDAGYNFDQINPNWTDVVRPSKLPSFKNQFAPDGSTFFGVRQTRLGVKGTVPTPIGDLKTTFEFELFGTGVDEGQTTFR